MKLGNLDITSKPMEVGPTCHYVMGGVRVEPETAMTTVKGLFAAGEVAGGLHGANRLGGIRLQISWFLELEQDFMPQNIVKKLKSHLIPPRIS